MELSTFKITKRDGSQDSFSLDKIMNAIAKAFVSVNKPVDLETISKILSHLNIHKDITVEEIQNQVEIALMKEQFFDVAKSFMLYRQRHTETRETLEKIQFLTDYCSATNAA
ncbi:MAG: ribonucleoside-triphosphate reductase, partial [Bacilli bacterium]|nr:ribonucleoside-triphosphate reductase [Bacilli bacterium]